MLNVFLQRPPWIEKKVSQHSTCVTGSCLQIWHRMHEHLSRTLSHFPRWTARRWRQACGSRVGARESAQCRWIDRINPNTSGHAKCNGEQGGVAFYRPYQLPQPHCSIRCRGREGTCAGEDANPTDSQSDAYVTVRWDRRRGLRLFRVLADAKRRGSCAEGMCSPCDILVRPLEAFCSLPWTCAWARGRSCHGLIYPSWLHSDDCIPRFDGTSVHSIVDDSHYSP